MNSNTTTAPEGKSPAHPDADILATWHRAKNAYDKAFTASDAADDYLASLTQDAAHHDTIAELCDLAVDAELAAREALILARSPDIGAFAWKMNHLFGQAARSNDGAPKLCLTEYYDVLLADLSRLKGGAA